MASAWKTLSPSGLCMLQLWRPALPCSSSPVICPSLYCASWCAAHAIRTAAHNRLWCQVNKCIKTPSPKCFHAVTLNFKMITKSNNNSDRYNKVVKVMPKLNFLKCFIKLHNSESICMKQNFLAHFPWSSCALRSQRQTGNLTGIEVTWSVSITGCNTIHSQTLRTSLYCPFWRSF